MVTFIAFGDLNFILPFGVRAAIDPPLNFNSVGLSIISGWLCCLEARVFPEFCLIMLLRESSLDIELGVHLSATGLCTEILDFPEFTREKICLSFPELSLELVCDFEDTSVECLELRGELNEAIQSLFGGTVISSLSTAPRDLDTSRYFLLL